MQKCERCQVNDVRVRLDSLANGRREPHYFCQQCAEEMLGGSLSNMPGDGTQDDLLGSFFNRMMGQNSGQSPLGFQSQGNAAQAQRKQDKADKNSKTPTLDQFGRDLTAEARDGKLDPAAGRDREMRRVMTVLGRRQKNNPVLIGEPGVGKTAIVEGIARRIAEGNVPATLRNARIISLNMGSMVAGAMFRGQFEERIKQHDRGGPTRIPMSSCSSTSCIPSSARALPRARSARPICSSRRWRVASCARLARRPWTSIASTSRRTPRWSAASSRCWWMSHPSRRPSPCCRRCASTTSAHHGVRISDEAVEAAVKLSDRYINDRFLPDKAIDVMDEAASSLRLDAIESGLIGPEMVTALERELASIAGAEGGGCAGRGLRDGRRSCASSELHVQKQLDEARGKAGDIPTMIVTPDDIAKVVEGWTGVPVTQMLETRARRICATWKATCVSVSSARARLSARWRGPSGARGPA